MGHLLHYLTWGYLWVGVKIALEVSIVSFVGSILLGLVVAEARASRFHTVRGIAWFYVWVMRGTPVLLQLLILYDALPTIGVELSPIWSAIIGFSLNGGAFLGEVIRGGMGAIPQTQIMAARSLGLSPFSTRRLVVIPQTLRAILPTLGNELITVIKGTSVASVISLNELTQRAEYVASQQFTYFPVLSAAAIIYLIITSAVTGIQQYCERRFSLDRPPPKPKSMFARLGPVEISTTLSAALATATGLSAEKMKQEPGHALLRRSHDAVPATLYREGSFDLGFVTCSDVHKSFGTQEVLQGVDLSVGKGEVVAIMGPSGSGKSTLLRLINHIDALDSGVITVDGRRVGYDEAGTQIHSARRLAAARAEARIGMVFQHFNLFDHLTARQNVALAPVHVYGADRRMAAEKAQHLLELVGLGPQVDRRPHQLSGGQQQRVAIARALAIEPRLMLFDEPTSALDPDLVQEVLQAMQSLTASGLTMIVVTHEVRFALEAADRVVRMASGRVLEEGRPDEVLRHALVRH